MGFRLGDDGIARIVLSRPVALNAFDPAMVDSLERAVDRCATEAGVRTVLISAEGGAFTVGGDLAHFAAHLDDLPGEFERMIGRYHRTLSRLARLAVPVVCAAQGGIAGGGLGLLWCSDFVLLADDAKVATAFSRLGFSGDGGSSWFLSRIVGIRRAFDLMLLGRTLTAQEAADWGLVNRVVPADWLSDEATALAQSLAAGPTQAFGEMRRLIRDACDACDARLECALGRELDAMKRCGSSSDGREGLIAFTERRAPNFRARSPNFLARSPD